MNKTARCFARGLLCVLPFLLLSGAVFLFAAFGVDAVIGENVYYRLLTNVPNQTWDVSRVTVKTVEEQELLRDNNEGSAFHMKADFPAIMLGEQWATLTIDSIDVGQLPVYHGDDSFNLLNGAGHYLNSRFPGQGGKIVISAHVNSKIYDFSRLETMTGGETVVLNTVYGDYIYRVRETVIFTAEDKAFLLPEYPEEEVLICYTCYPFETSGLRTQRFAIVCDLVSGDDWTREDTP